MEVSSGKAGKEEAVTYHSRDNLKNFQIKVILRKLISAGDARVMLRNSLDLTEEQEEWTFKWQQKVFSQQEEEIYADANNCINTVEEQYHREILDIRRKGGRANRRLFCYVEKDGYKKPVTLISPPVTDRYSEDQTFAVRYSSSVRRRPVSRLNRGLKEVVIRKPVSYEPSNNERISHRMNLPSSQSMFIMADLRMTDKLNSPDEHVLCHITVDDNGAITLRPDFNRDKAAYRIENRQREVFEYYLEHASQPPSEEDRISEKRVMAELCHQHLSNMRQLVGTSFADPPEGGSLRVMLHGQIVSAKGFEYNDLYVTAYLDVPELWELEDQDCYLCPRSQLPAVITQISSTRSQHKYNIAHFACPFEYSLLLHAPTSKDSIPKWPRILLEVASLDYWDRHRVEGYGFVDIPSVPGSYDLHVATWRLTGKRLVDKMRRFFVGGSPEIDDITYVASPKDFNGTHLSRFGVRTETSGSVHIHLNITHQSSLLVKNTDRTKYQGFRSAVAAVLESYHRAKDRAAASLTATGAAAVIPEAEHTL